MSQDGQVELDGAKVNQINSEFYQLGSKLVEGLRKPDLNNLYTKAEIKQVRDALDKASYGAEFGVSEGVSVRDVLVESLLYKKEEPPASAREIENMNKLIDQADGNMKALDALVDSVSKDVNNAPQSTQSNVATSVTKTVAIDSNGNEVEPDPRILRLEQALAQIVPTLNGLTTHNDKPDGIDISPSSKIDVAGRADGFLDSNTLESYQDTMQHLNYLAVLKDSQMQGAVNSFFNKLGMDVGAVDKNQKRGFDSKNTKMISDILTESLTSNIKDKNDELIALLKNSGNPSEIRELDSRVKELEVLRDGVPDMMKDIGDLEREGKLSTAVSVNTIVEKQAVSSAPAVQLKDKVIIPPVKNIVSSVAPETTASVKNNAPITEEERKSLLKASEVTNEGNKNAINEARLGESIVIVETALVTLSKKIKDFDKMGLSESIITPLKISDIGGEFGANSQDILSKAIVLVKTLANERKPEDQRDRNPNGVYTPEFGKEFRYEVLTNPALQPIRDVLGIGQVMDAATQKDYFRTLSAAASDEDKAKQAALRADIDKKFGLGHDPDDKEAYSKTLNGFIASLDNISNSNLINEEKAKQTTKMNIMLDGMYMAMDKWAPGMSGMLKDFFTGSDFGKMIGGILSMFGINVNRLWGDKNDKGVEAVRPLIDKGFDSFVKGAENKLGDGADFKTVMEQAKADMIAKLKDPGSNLFDKGKKWAFNKSMDKVFAGKGEKFIEDAVSNAMDAAIAAGEINGNDYGAAKVAFFDSLKEAGANFQDNNNLTIKKMNKGMSDLTAMVKNSPAREAVAKYEAARAKEVTPESVKNSSSSKKEISPAMVVGSKVTATTSSVNEGTSSVKNSSSSKKEISPAMAVGSKVTATTSSVNKGTNSVNEGTNVDGEKPATDDDKLIAVSDNTKVGLIFTPNTKSFYQGTKRFSIGRVDDIQIGLSELDLIITADMIKNEKGVFSDMATPNTSAMMEEALVRAQIWQLNKDGKEITQDVLDGLEHKFTTENLPTYLPILKEYMKSEGVSPDKIEAVVKNLTELAGDYYSTDPNDKLAGKPQKLSVLDQSFLDKQFALDMKHFAPKQVVKVKEELEVAPIEVKKSITVIVPDEESVSNTFNARSGCNYDDGKPETFTDLCLVTPAQEAIIKEKGLDVEMMSNQAFNASPNSQFVIIDLSRLGIKGAGLPDVIAVKYWGDQYKTSMEFRAVDYKKAGILPLENQRAGGLSDMGQLHTPPYGGRRLDTILSIYEIKPGGVITQGAVGGYPYMMAIVPNDNGDGAMVQNAMEAIYGKEALTVKAMNEYSSGQYSRWSSRAGYIVAQRYYDQTGTLRGQEPIIKNAGQYPSPQGDGRIESFNRSGSGNPDDINAQINDNTEDMGVSDDNAWCGFDEDEEPCVDDVTVISNPSQQLGTGARQ